MAGASLDAIASSPPKLNLKILLLLSFGHLVTDIYQGALPAILPFLKAKLNLSYTMAGVILLAANIASSVVQPLFGYLSDKKSKAVLLPIGCLAAGAGLSLLSLPATFDLVLLLVILSGLGVASYHPEGYKTAHFFTGEKKATGMAVFSVGGNLGLALGPILALGLVSHWGFDRLPLMVVFSFIFIGMLFFQWDSLHTSAPTSAAAGAAGGPAGPGAYVSLFLIIAAVVARSWTQLGLMTYIPFYYIDFVQGDPLYSGKLVTVLLLGGVLGSILGSVVGDRFGHKQCLVVSLAVTSVLLPLVLVVNGLMLFVLLGAVGLALISSFTVTIVMAQRLLPTRLGVASGLMVGFAIGTGGLGVTLLGMIADRFGVPMALRAIMLLPPMGLLFSFFVRYPGGHGPERAAG